MRYSVVFWDSGGTIFHSHDRPEGFAGCPTPGQVRDQRAFRAARALEMFGHSPPPELPAILKRQEAESRERHGALFSLETFATAVYDRLGVHHRDEETLMLADALGGPRYRGWLWDGVAEALTTLDKAKVRMGVIADTDLTGRMMRGVLTGVGLVDVFGPIVCSCDHGVLKPDARTFALALSRLVPAPSGDERVLYVGDNLIKDIEGAAAFGWDAAHHLTTSGEKKSKAVLSFRDYADLVRLVLDDG